jgi:hypothetical protein
MLPVRRYISVRASFVCATFCASLLACLFALSVDAWAKEASLTAIELYPGASGSDYAQLANVTINGKTEVRLCGGSGPIDKNSYGKLPKVTLAVGMSLERDSHGVLLLTRGADTSCAVPDNLKLDKDSPLSPSDLADRANLQGQAVAGSDGTPGVLSPLKPGVKLVFVAAPDPELAEYLRAERDGTVGFWQKYLDRYPTGAHAGVAKSSLAALYVRDGESSFAQYRESVTKGTPNYEALKSAKTAADQALVAAPGDDAATGLSKKVHDEVEALAKRSETELQQYRQALSAEKPGYTHLVTAQTLANAAAGVDPKSAPAIAAAKDCQQERASFDATIQTAQGQMAAQNYDQALQTITSLRAFSGENADVRAILHSVYSFHLDRAAKLGESGDWPGAVKEYQSAADIHSNAEVLASLKNAQDHAHISGDKAAAQAAQIKSQELEASRDFIGAYEVLDTLPATQRALCTERLDELKDRYVQAATQAAIGLQKTHEPIRGISDEQGIERAYAYLQRCYALTENPALQDRIASLADALSAYYLQQGKRYMERPAGIGTNVGWTYLNKAVQLKASNVEEVRDEIARDTSAYQLRSKLSIRVGFRDQTSLRDSTGFASQLADALATGLETSGLPIKVVRPGETASIEPNFALIGDVLRHEVNTTSDENPKDSKYRAGEREIPNDKWNLANREYESATLELQSQQRALEGATAHGKKKDIENANSAVAAAQAKVEAAHARLDAIPKSIPEDIERPYTYTEVTTRFSEVVELQFRVLDNSGSVVVPIKPVTKTAEKKYTLLKDVKPEDTTGVRAQGTTLDPKAFQSSFENDVRDELIKKTLEQVGNLPATLLDLAGKKASEGDVDGAAELYILYLNSTPQGSTVERGRAQKFLVDQFNFNHFVS